MVVAPGVLIMIFMETTLATFSRVSDLFRFGNAKTSWQEDVVINVGVRCCSLEWKAEYNSGLVQ